jgi:hypothetical protein
MPPQRSKSKLTPAVSPDIILRQYRSKLRYDVDTQHELVEVRDPGHLSDEVIDEIPKKS